MSHLEFWAAIGAAAGVYLFFQGFRMLRLKRLILNTPLSKVRSASMGLVEICGMASGPHTIPAGITGDPCYAYHARAWRLRQDGKESDWDLIFDESAFVPFFVEDATGRILVDARGAQLDVHPNFSDQVGLSFFHSGMTPPNISQFLFQNGLGSAEGVRLEERCIKPNYPLFAFGTFGRNSLEHNWAPQPCMAVAPASASSGSWLDLFNVSFAVASRPFATFASSGSLNRAAGVASRALSVSGTAPAPLVPRSGLATATAALPQNQRAGNSQVALAEPPVAAASAAPSGVGDDTSDLDTTVAIGKGPEGAPFTLSSSSPREVVQSLAWKSTLFIWGGPILTVGCLYFLALAFRWM
jgi:E3 Ubiquitin ligase